MTSELADIWCDTHEQQVSDLRAENVTLTKERDEAIQQRDREHDTVVHYQMLFAKDELHAQVAALTKERERQDAALKLAVEALVKTREACVAIDKWSHGLRHQTAHESKMVKLGKAALFAIDACEGPKP